MRYEQSRQNRCVLQLQCFLLPLLIDIVNLQQTHYSRITRSGSTGSSMPTKSYTLAAKHVLSPRNPTSVVTLVSEHTPPPTSVLSPNGALMFVMAETWQSWMHIRMCAVHLSTMIVCRRPGTDRTIQKIGRTKPDKITSEIHEDPKATSQVVQRCIAHIAKLLYAIVCTNIAAFRRTT